VAGAARGEGEGADAAGGAGWQGAEEPALAIDWDSPGLRLEAKLVEVVGPPLPLPSFRYYSDAHLSPAPYTSDAHLSRSFFVLCSQVKGPGDRLMDRQTAWLGALAAGSVDVAVCRIGAFPGRSASAAPPPPLSPGTKRTHRVPSPVLRGHAASLPPY